MEEAVTAISAGDESKLSLCLQQMALPLRDYAKLIILTCKHKRSAILNLLVSENVELSSSSGEETTECWDSKDEDGHNAVYYAIRSGNVELLEMLLTSSVCPTLPELLDQLLSVSYDELKLKNVLLSNEMELFVQSTLANLRFYSRENDLPTPTSPDKDLIKKRLELIIQNIQTLTTEYFQKKVDNRFIYIAKFIARNMHISKQALKSTYSEVPWEEMEFCLVCFISAHTKLTEMNLFYLSVLRKGPLLKVLADFSQVLRDLEKFIDKTDVSKLNSKGRWSREKVISDITSKCPQFKDLYNDYRVIRDICSLDIMKRYIDLALPVDPATREGQLTIKRTLQVLGENLKDTLDSPNLSTAVSDLLLFLAPMKTRSILKELRNAISHVHFSQDNEEATQVTKLYSNILNDIKKITTVVSDICYLNKINILKQIISEEFVESENYVEILRNLNELPMLSSCEGNQDTTKEHQNIGNIIEEINQLVSDKTQFEEEALSEIKFLCECKIKNINLKEDFFRITTQIRSINNLVTNTPTSTRISKFWNQWRRNYFSPKATIYPTEEHELEVFQELQKISNSFYESVSLRIPPEVANNVQNLLFTIEILHVNEKNAINWIDEYKTQLSLHKNREEGGEAIIKGKNVKEQPERKISQKQQKKLNAKQRTEAIIDGRNVKQRPIDKHHNEGINVKEQPNDKHHDEAIIEGRNVKEQPNEKHHNEAIIKGKNLKKQPNDKHQTEVIIEERNVKEQPIDKHHDEAIIKGKNLKKQPNDKHHTEAINEGKNLKKQPNDKHHETIIKGKNVKEQPNDNDNNLEKQITQHLCELGDVMGTGRSHHASRNLFPLLQKSNQYKLRIEVLMLDTMSLLEERTKCLSNNSLYLDDNMPLLSGRILRNYLAHGNPLVDNILSSDSFSAVVLNTMILIEPDTEKRVILNKGKMGKILTTDITHLIKKFDRNLEIINKQEAMFTALVEGNLEVLKTCLREGADLHSRCLIDFSTTLHAAAKGTNVEIIKMLIENNLSPDSRDINGQTPLHRAAAFGRDSIVKFLVKEKSILVDQPDITGKTPLHLAALNGHKEIVETLLNLGANANIKDGQNFSALHYAIANNCIESAKVLLVNTTVDSGGLTPLHVAVEHGHTELVQYLLENGADVNAKTVQGTRPLELAAANGHQEIVESLLKHGAFVNLQTSGGLTPLHLAVISGHEDIVNILLRKGAFVDIICKLSNNTPLQTAIYNGDKRIVKIILQNDPNINSLNNNGFTPLFTAAWCGNSDIVELLLDTGVQLNYKNPKGFTVLHVSAMSGHNDIVTALIKRGIVIDAIDSKRLTPLHLAAEGGHIETVNTLLAADADVCSVDDDGSTPLHLSAGGTSEGHVAVSQSLININRSNINTKNKMERTPLHLAANKACNEKTVQLLLNNGANIEDVCVGRNTALHLASSHGYTSIVEVLINGQANVHAVNVDGNTALHLAVKGNHTAIVKLLLDSDKGVDINAVNVERYSALCYAAQNNNKDILDFLLEKEADVYSEGGKPLIVAVSSGRKFVVEVMLKHIKKLKIDIDIEGPSFLLAAILGHWHIGRALINSDKGVKVNSIGPKSATALLLAVQGGHKEFVDLLLSNGADANLAPDGTSPLHLAATLDYPDVVKSLLLSGAKHDTPDANNRTPIELTIHHKRLNNLKHIFDVKKPCDIKINARRNDLSLLDIAAQVGELKVVKYLIEQGADLNSRDSGGCTAMDVAAYCGHQKIVELCLDLGMSVGKLGERGPTPLHAAVTGGQPELAQYLIDKHADVNAVDARGKLPIHYAAMKGNKKDVNVLLSNGSMFNYIDDAGNTPLELTTDADIKQLLVSIRQLFKAVKKNNVSEAENLIKNIGRPICANNFSLLCFASREGFQEICDLLLNNGVNPNAAGKDGKTPLHHASEFSHRRIVVSLLQNGAVYNIESKSGETPLDLATQEGVISFLKLVEESFKKASNCDKVLIEDIVKIGDIEIIKALLKSRDRQDSTLVEVAIKNNFPEVDRLYQILQDQFSVKLKRVKGLVKLENFKEALSILRELLRERVLLLGVDDPGTLLIFQEVALISFHQSDVDFALNTFKGIYRRRKNVLGPNNQVTLQTRSHIAAALARLGRNQKALEVFQEVIAKQETLDGDHADLLQTKTDAAECLEDLKQFDKALKMNYEVLETLQKSGLINTQTLAVQSNIASVLRKQGKFEEALRIIKKVYEDSKIIHGKNHRSTLQARGHWAQVLDAQGQTAEALEIYQEVLAIQRNVLGPYHGDTLCICRDIVQLYLFEGRIYDAHRVYREGLEHRDSNIDNPLLLKLDSTFKRLKESITNGKHPQIDKNLLESKYEKDLFQAVCKGDIDRVDSLIRCGSDVNTVDPEGRTPLHFATDGRYTDIVKLLLKSGTDSTIASLKGNTALHTAALRGCVEINETLLQTVKAIKACAYNDFINAKTIVGGVSALHVAAKKGFLDVVKCLLEHGAIYNSPDRANGHTPLQCSSSQAVTSVLELAQEMFDCAERGELPQISAEKQEYAVVVLSSRDTQHRTPIQVAQLYHHNNVVDFLESLNKPT